MYVCIQSVPRVYIYKIEILFHFWLFNWKIFRQMRGVSPRSFSENFFFFFVDENFVLFSNGKIPTKNALRTASPSES